jgi:hypothetical protein
LFLKSPFQRIKNVTVEQQIQKLILKSLLRTFFPKLFFVCCIHNQRENEAS